MAEGMAGGRQGGDNVHISPGIVACDVPTLGNSNLGFGSGIWRERPS